MKNLIINIYKTLFFFDLSIVVVYYLPQLNGKTPALSALFDEGIFFAVMLIFTVFFLSVAERRRLKVFNFKNKLRHYSIGLLSGIAPVSLTASVLLLLRSLKLSGINKLGAVNIALWLAAMLLNAAANELLLRGYLFRLYRKYYSLPVTVTFISLLFVSLNPGMLSGGIIYILNMLLTNITLCLLAEYSYSLLAPVTARFFYNVLSAFMLGSFSVSEAYPVLLKTAFSGNKYLSGGAMKLEGSVIMLLANALLCTFFIIGLKKRKEGRAL